MPALGQKHSDKSKARISDRLRRRHERRRQAARVEPAALRHFERAGIVAEALKPLVAIAQAEARELIEALGGPDQVSPQRRAIVEDLVAVGVVLRAELARFLETRDSEAASRIGTLASTRRASLAAIGLDRHQHDVTESYARAIREHEVAQRNAQAPAGAEIATRAEAQVEPTVDREATGHAASDAQREEGQS